MNFRMFAKILHSTHSKLKENNCRNLVSNFKKYIEQQAVHYLFMPDCPKWRPNEMEKLKEFLKWSSKLTKIANFSLFAAFPLKKLNVHILRRMWLTYVGINGKIIAVAHKFANLKITSALLIYSSLDCST